MDASPFFYPTIYWVLPFVVLIAVGGYFLLGNIVAGLFLGCVVGLIGYVTLEAMLNPQMERWMARQRVYAILFTDFPADKDHYVSEYASAYKAGGQQALSQKEQEMKIIMMEHHVKHYIERAHAQTLRQYIVAETWMLSTLQQKDKNLCNQYLLHSKYFANAWNAVGSKIFLAPLEASPEIIIEATDSPEAVTDADRAHATELFAKMVKSLMDAGVLNNGGLSALLSCDTVYREFYMLSQMPAKDGALVVKLMLSENHLQQPAETGLLKKLLPF